MGPGCETFLWLLTICAWGGLLMLLIGCSNDPPDITTCVAGNCITVIIDPAVFEGRDGNG